MDFLSAKRCVSILLLLACASGCSFTKSTTSDPSDIAVSPDASNVTLSQPVNKCSGNLKACKYEVAYERGESNYAIQEAKRLNIIALQKFRDSLK